MNRWVNLNVNYALLIKRLIFFCQGHASPGNYASSYLMDKLTLKQIENFRREVSGEGISSYPHPWLMPDFWEFPTVSMGLGPIQAIYKARFLNYMQKKTNIQKL